MFSLLRKFRRNQSGATAIEYALIAAVMGVGILAGAQTLRTSWNNSANSSAGVLDGTNAPAATP